MRRILGFIGGKASPGDILEELSSELLGAGVSAQVWERLLALDNLEEVLENQPRRESLVICLTRCPDNFFGLIEQCLDTIESELAKKADDDDDTAYTILPNALFVLSYLLAALPAAVPPGVQEDAAQAASRSFVDRLWQVSENSRPCGERIADAAMRALFHDGFTVDYPDDADVSEVNGMVPALIWQEGVGPEGSSQPKNSDMQADRVVGLQLLLAFLAAGAPSASVFQENNDEDAAAVNARLSRLVIPDARPLSYLCDARRKVPFRGELFYSLLSVALGYDPHGYGLPYGGYFAGAKQEAFAQLCIQALGLLLQDVRDAAESNGDLSIVPSVVIRRPQELLISQKSIPEEEGALVQNAFREMLASISSQGEVEFMVEGMVTLLGTVSKEKGSYLPSSMRLPSFLAELLVVVLHLTTCPKFVAGLCAEGEIISLIEGVLLAASQAPEHVCEVTLSLIEAAILLNLTSYRDVCVELDEDFDGSLPESIPDFEGTAVDFVALAALVQANDNLSKCKASKVHENIVQMSLFTLANVSTFAEGFCIEVTSRLFSLFERCAKTLHMSRERLGLASQLPIVLEVFNNALQYRYSGNSNLAYGLMTRQAIFRDLMSTVPQVQRQLDLGKEGAGSTETKPWQQQVEVHLHPIAMLLDAVVPMLEAEVEKHEISNSEEAKELLPRCILGLMPPPHAFQMRHLKRCAASHLACEHILAACLGDGPVSPLWEVEEEPEDASQRGRSSETKSEPRKSGREKSGSRTRSASNSRAKGGAKAAPAESGVRPKDSTANSEGNAKSASVPCENRPGLAAPNGSGHDNMQADVAEQDSPKAASPTAPVAVDALASQLQEAVASGVDVAQLLAQLQAAKAAAKEGES
mmetsp:Transcript_35041/g.80672  ORF Transcript_35041/g.80672 Transcript_35041/m.80672 type:complete len:869 (+) Transcript_35041:57-2663(+)